MSAHSVIGTNKSCRRRPWWHHQMETFSALLALCERNSPVTGEFPSQRPVTRSYDVFFDLRLNKRLSKQSIRRWLRRHRAYNDAYNTVHYNMILHTTRHRKRIAHKLGIELTIHTYPALTGELLGFLRDSFGEKPPCYNAAAFYVVFFRDM